MLAKPILSVQSEDRIAVIVLPDCYDRRVLLAQIESFVVVAQSRNVTRAAEALSISQPTLTGRIKALEAELGATLFHRTRTGVHLTEAGMAFLPHAERTLAAAADAARAVADLKRGGGILTVALAPMITFTVMPEVMRRFRERRPRSRLTIRTTSSADVVEMVLRSDVALGISRDLRHPDLERTVLYHDDLVLIAPPGHRLASLPSIALDDLAGEDFVLFDRSFAYYELTTALFDGATVVPRGVVTVDNVGAAIHMVRAGLGLAIVPRSGLADSPAGAVRIIQVANATPAHITVVALRRRDAGPLSDAQADLTALVREVGSAASASTSLTDLSGTPS
jgi:DNA-binding transcriptional LysR family regulator